MSEVYLRNLASNVVDLSPLAFDVGVLFNPIGNFSLVKLPNGNWLCSMRKFGYYISSVTQAYSLFLSLSIYTQNRQTVAKRHIPRAV